MSALAVAGSVLLALAGDAPAAPALDTAAAERLVAESCQSCHAASMLTQQRLTAQQWQASVKKMRGWGALLSDADADLLARYLAARYGPEAPAAATPQVDAAAAAAELAPLPDGPFARGDATIGKGIYDEVCVQCHGPDARGASPAPNLVDRPLLQRAPDFARAVRTGRGRMPPMALGDVEVAALLAFLRTLER